MRIQSGYPKFDALFRYYNQLWGQIDSALKRQVRHPLTLTGLQVLTRIAQDRAQRAESTQANIAEALGLNPSTLSTTVRALEARGYVQVQRTPGYRNQPLSLTAAGRQAALQGQVATDDVLEQFAKALPRRYQRSFFAALEGANAALAKRATDDRRERYMKSLTKHSTRAHARTPGRAIKKPKWMRSG